MSSPLLARGGPPVMQGDAALQDFLATFSGLMGDQFARLAADQAGSGASSSHTGGTGAPAPGGAGAQEIGLSEVKTTRKAGSGASSSGAAAPAAATSGGRPTAASLQQLPDSKTVAKAARRGEIGNDDEEVRRVLSNPVVVELLRDPQMQRIMEECRHDATGARLAYYLRIPAVAQRLKVLQDAGLISIRF